MEEIWKDIEGIEGYQISNIGRVRSLNYQGTNKTRLLKTQTLSKYETVMIKHKTYLVHRLVAKAFIPNPLGLSDINHKDENKLNNTVENLEWMSHYDNMQYSLDKMGRPKKKIICVETQEVFDDAETLSKKIGCSSSHIANICSHTISTQHYKGLHYEYIG